MSKSSQAIQTVEPDIIVEASKLNKKSTNLKDEPRDSTMLSHSTTEVITTKLEPNYVENSIKEEVDQDA